MTAANGAAGVVIVNYNCAPLALDAALSALGDDKAARAVIVDNASTDDSLAYFSEVLSGTRPHISEAPARGPEPVRFASLALVSSALAPADAEAADAQLSILTASDNRGFAAGCNIGMRFLERAAAPDWFLLLNPDALVAAGAMDAFRQRLEDPAAGLAGASVLRFEPPHIAQVFGGARLHPLTLQGRNLGAEELVTKAPSQAEIEAALDYPLGAAMALRADYRQAAGDLDERFFLYFEEADWARRGAPDRRPVWAADAIVYHRHGAAAGSRERPGVRSAFADFHMARSRMLFAMKWRPFIVPLVLALSLAQAARRMGRGHWRQARAVLAGAFGFPGPAAVN